MAFQELNDEQLIVKVFEVERALVAARFKHSMNQLENSSELKNLRRDIARLRTEARDREIAQGLAKDSLLSKHSAAAKGSVASSEAIEEKGGFLKGIVDKISGND